MKGCMDFDTIDRSTINGLLLYKALKEATMGYKAGRKMGTLTYAKADRELGSRDEITIGNNTKLVRRDDGIAVRHWSTDIITYHPDDSISLIPHNSVTTKARYNAYLNQRVWAEDGWMLICSNGIDYEFKSDLTINKDGDIDAVPVVATKLAKYTGKEIFTWEAVVKTIKEFSLEEMEKVWNRLKKYRIILARYCTETFLPLIIGKDEYDKDWYSIATERLRK